MKISDVILRLIGRDSSCPNETDILRYSEGRLPENRRVQFDRHFTGCDDCREVLAFLGREAEETAAPLTEAAVFQQTDRILTYIQNDERNRRRATPKVRVAAGLHSYPRLASAGLVVCAMAVSALFFLTGGQSPADGAMEALRLGLKDGRHTEARISGGLPYSRFAGVSRGGDRNDDDLHFSRAENKVKAAEQENAPVNERLTLARVYLARGTRPDAQRALTILTQLAARGVETPDALNDTGVAYLQLENYDEAIANFSKALAKSPSYDEALFNRALAEERADRDDDARRDWKQFISQASDDNWKTEAIEKLKRLEK